MADNTLIRSAAVTQAYRDAQAAKANFRDEHDYTDRTNDVIIREFKHWYIKQNNFPYDLIATVHDLLIPRRVFATLDDCTPAEWDEYRTIMRQLAAEKYYDIVLENFPKDRSIMKHLHLHLIVYKTASGN